MADSPDGDSAISNLNQEAEPLSAPKKTQNNN